MYYGRCFSVEVLMDREQLERIIATNQAALDQLWIGDEANQDTLKQIIGVSTLGLITHYLQLVMIQVDHNINKRKLEQM